MSNSVSEPTGDVRLSLYGSPCLGTGESLSTIVKPTYKPLDLLFLTFKPLFLQTPSSYASRRALPVSDVLVNA